MEFKRIRQIDINELNQIIDLIKKFIVDGKESEADCHIVYQEMKNSLENGYVFAMSGNNQIMGILSVSVVKMHGWINTAFVHFISIDTPSVGVDRTRKFIEYAIDEVKKSGIENIMFNTRRNEDAFLRLLPRKWKRDSVTLKLCA